MTSDIIGLYNKKKVLDKKYKDVFYSYNEHKIRRIVQDSDKKSFEILEEKLNTGIDTEDV